ncbi:hypothetical protein [Candidatus Magnetominusculus dajiuhuensis]|uniref:hypothetical protein n=1 Tax=Candidatus Magnetominusculus dajiuhuensis TaxID=3137712 RepID=UPI003B42B527
MPVQVARNIEFFINEYVEKGLITEDIKLNPVILTSEQVAYYSLPKIPIKETDKRKGNFEAIHGEGAVELDALEALHPEELGKIIEDNIMQFYDVELVDKVQSAKKEADRRIQMRYSERIEHYKAREQELKKRG